MSLSANDVMLNNWIHEQTADAVSVVDFGAGFFDKLKLVPKMARKIGIEVFVPYHAYAPMGVRVIGHDFIGWEQYVAKQDRDCAMLIDTLEHVTKDEGITLLASLAAFRKVLVFTPLGFVTQEHDVTGYGNEWQRHLCGWTPEELTAQGFDVSIVADFHGPELGAILAVRA